MHNVYTVDYNNIITHAKRHARLFTLFISLTFENYERYFFNEILVLIKSKNINVCCFFNDTNNNFYYRFFKKKIIIEKVV